MGSYRVYSRYIRISGLRAHPRAHSFNFRHEDLWVKKALFVALGGAPR